MRFAAGAHSARLGRQEGSRQPTGHEPSLLASSALGPRLTVLVHSGLQALLQPAGLALVPVGLVHRAHPCPHLAPAGGGAPGVGVRPGPWTVGFGRLRRGRVSPNVPAPSPVDEPPSDASLEEAAAAVAGVDAVVLPAAAVPAHAAPGRGSRACGGCGAGSRASHLLRAPPRPPFPLSPGQGPPAYGPARPPGSALPPSRGPVPTGERGLGACASRLAFLPSAGGLAPSSPTAPSATPPAALLTSPKGAAPS